MMRPFLIRLVGSLHSFVLYDMCGVEITNLMVAAEFAESSFSDSWECVFNDDERDDYLEVRV